MAVKVAVEGVSLTPAQIEISRRLQQQQQSRLPPNNSAIGNGIIGNLQVSLSETILCSYRTWEYTG